MEQKQKKHKKKIEGKVQLPEGVSVKLSGSSLALKGPKGEFSRNFLRPYISIEIDGQKVLFKASRQTQKEKKAIGSFVAHLKNMAKGVLEGHMYILKVCAGHFPIVVSVSGDDFIVKNFLGEKTPRKMKIKKGATVKVEGDKITVESIDREIAGMVSADIEQLTRRPGFDTRVFQDGIYIISKAGKESA